MIIFHSYFVILYYRYHEVALFYTDVVENITCTMGERIWKLSAATLFVLLFFEKFSRQDYFWTFMEHELGPKSILNQIYSAKLFGTSILKALVKIKKKAIELLKYFCLKNVFRDSTALFVNFPGT